MPPRLSELLFNVDVVLMVIVLVAGLLNVYIDMNSNRRKCIIELITTIALFLFLLALGVVI